MLSNSPQHPHDEDNSWKAKVVFLVGSLLLMMVLLSLNGCGTIKYVDRWNTEYRDTTIYQREVKDSLIYVPIPLESNQAIVEIGDTSRLETSVAKSVAYIDEKGRICHTLENKREKLPALVPVTSTIINHKVTSNSTHTITNVQWRDKPLTWWQSLKIRSFWYLCAAVVLLLCYIFRKPLLALLKLIFKL